MSVTISTTDQYPVGYNLVVYKGASFSRTFTWTSGPDENDQTPVDLTGATASMSIKSGQDTVVSLTTENGRITLGGAAGTIVLSLTAADTVGLAGQNAEYDLLVTMADDSVVPLLAGLVVLRASVTAGS